MREYTYTGREGKTWTYAQQTRESILDIERTGTSLHIWVGPIGLHLWRHKGTHKVAPINLDWDWGYWR